MRIKKLNYPLIIGGFIVLCLLILYMFGEDIARVDPYAINLGNPEYKNGILVMESPPLPPNQLNIFGTDVLGRDIYSQIVVGTRITLRIAFLIVLFRFILALPLAFLSGFGKKTSSAIIKFFSTAFNAVPGLIISIMLLSLRPLSNLDLEKSTIAFVAVLTFVGWGRVAKILRDRIKAILSQDFIRGETAIGKNNFLIAIQNVLPHLIPSIIVYFFLELGRALLLLAALGVFGIHVGVNRINRETISMLRLTVVPGYNPEWGGMLATARYAITVWKPWSALFPALAFFISIMGFNLLGEGLQHEISKRNSMVITWIKRLAFHLSPKTLLYELKDFRNHKKSLGLKITLVGLLVIIPLIPPPKSLYKIDGAALWQHVVELAKDDYEGRLVGTKGRDEAAKYIKNSLDNGKIKPLFSDTYYDDFTIRNPIAHVSKANLTITDQSGDTGDTFILRRDFKFNRIFYKSSKGNNDTEKIEMVKEIQGEILTYEAYMKGSYDENKEYFLVVNHPTQISNLDNTRFIHGIIIPVENTDSLKTKGFFDLTNIEIYRRDKIKRRASPISIYASRESHEKLKENLGSKLTLSIDGELTHNTRAVNVGGIIEGKDTEHPIMIITSYDYHGYEEGGEYKGLYANGTSIAAALEIGRRLSEIEGQPQRSIGFTFTDASRFLSKGASILSLREFMDENVFYIYLNYLGVNDKDNFYIDTSLISEPTDENYDYVKYIKKRAKQLNLDIYQGQLGVDDMDVSILKGDGGSGILLKSLTSEEEYQYFNMEQKDIEVINREHLEKQVQLILDTIIEIAY